jgi:excisionase family DNA binding protein
MARGSIRGGQVVGETWPSAPSAGTQLPDLYTPEEVAARLRVSRRTVYEWLKLGRLRAFRAGRGWRIRHADLEAFMMPEDAWQQRLDQTIERVRSRVPPEISPEEIEADITAADEEDRRERSARRH